MTLKDKFKLYFVEPTQEQICSLSTIYGIDKLIDKNFNHFNLIKWCSLQIINHIHQNLMINKYDMDTFQSCIKIDIESISMPNAVMLIKNILAILNPINKFICY